MVKKPATPIKARNSAGEAAIDFGDVEGKFIDVVDEDVAGVAIPVWQVIALDCHDWHPGQ
jgi:hypothetical protein